MRLLGALALLLASSVACDVCENRLVVNDPPDCLEALTLIPEQEDQLRDECTGTLPLEGLNTCPADVSFPAELCGGDECLFAPSTNISVSVPGGAYEGDGAHRRNVSIPVLVGGDPDAYRLAVD